MNTRDQKDFLKARKEYEANLAKEKEGGSMTDLDRKIEELKEYHRKYLKTNLFDVAIDQTRQLCEERLSKCNQKLKECIKEKYRYKEMAEQHEETIYELKAKLASKESGS